MNEVKLQKEKTSLRCGFMETRMCINWTRIEFNINYNFMFISNISPQTLQPLLLMNLKRSINYALITLLVQ